MRIRYVVAVLLAGAAATVAVFTLAQGSSSPAAKTKIKHLVVIFDENQSFDHYFGTYPSTPPKNSTEPAFVAVPGTPTPDNYVAKPSLLTANPNSAQPNRLDRSAAVTCDQNHAYSPEQLAFNGGAMDKFVENTAGGGCTDKSIVMGYYDGNTVTGLWNLAQRNAMSDNFFGDTFGPSTPGAINLISGQTHGVSAGSDADGSGTIIADPNPMDDDCGGGSARMTGTNIGDQMNAANVTWGWFQGGFKPTAVAGGVATCGTTHTNVGGGASVDYSAHHEPFQYYASTENAHHLPPTSVGAIGTTDQANHQYDLTDFDAAVKAGNLPQVSFLKPASFEDAHPGNSDPLDEQRFIARTLNGFQQSPDWSSTAVVITYDDSDGWYDHKFSPVKNPSMAASDALNGPGKCGSGAPADGFQDRCGPGPRLPFLVISPYARPNFVGHTFLNQSSITKFIENNWKVKPIGGSSYDTTATDFAPALLDFKQAPNPPAFLDPTTGKVVACQKSGQGSSPSGASSSAKCPKPVKPVLTVSAKRGAKSVTVKLGVGGLAAADGPIGVSLKLTSGRSTIATGKGIVTSGKVTVTLKAKKPVGAGSYKLAVTVTQAKKSTTQTSTLKLK